MSSLITDTIIGLGGKVLDRVLPDQVARDEAKLKLLELAQNGELAQLRADTDLALAQIEVNKIEAASPSFWVSGWRPAVGWVCVLGLLYAYLIRPIFSAFALKYLGAPLEPIDLGELLVLLGGILGVGGLRSFDKLKGTSR